MEVSGETAIGTKFHFKGFVSFILSVVLCDYFLIEEFMAHLSLFRAMYDRQKAPFSQLRSCRCELEVAMWILAEI